MNRLARTMAIRRGEGRLVGTVALAFASVEAGRGLGEVAVLSLVLDRAGTSILPALYIALGLVALVATLTFGTAVGRSSGAHLFPASLLMLGLLIACEGILAGVVDDIRVDAIAWVSVMTAGALLTTILWTVAARVFDARQAKRLFPLCAGAAIAGGFVGLLATGPLAHLVGLEALIVGQGLLVAIGGFALLRLRADVRRRTPSGAGGFRGHGSLRAGAAYVARSPLLRLVCIAYLLFSVLLFSLAYPFSGAMAAAFPDPADLATALGLMAAAVTAISFVLAMVAANRLYARFGVATVALLLPVVYLAGFGIWLVSFTTVTAIGVKVAQEVTQRGLSNTAWSALFTIVPAARRGQTLAFVDGVPGQLGTVLSGLLLLGATSGATFGASSGAATAGEASKPAALLILGGATAAAGLAVVVLIRRRYAASLMDTLRQSPAEQVLEGGPGLAVLARDPRVVAQLRGALSSDRAGERRLAIELLGELSVHEAAADIGTLADDPDPSVRRATVGALDRLGRTRWLDAEVVDRLVADPEPRVRAALAVAWCRGQDRAADGRTVLEQLLASEATPDRVAGLDAVAELSAPLSSGADWDVESRLVSALGDPSLAVRAAASRALKGRADAADEVMHALRSGSPTVQDAALAALEGSGPLVRDALVTWAVGQVDRAAVLRRYATVLGSGVVDGPGLGTTVASAAFLADLLRRRGSSIEARLVQTLAILGAPEASGLLRRSLISNDSESRAQAIEALDALRQGPLGRAVVRLLDSDPPAARPDRSAVAQVARALATEQADDVWVRALALRTLAVAGGVAMPESRSTVDEIDRMLLLRRVPLFGALAPEDLQRLSATAHERTYQGDEVLVRQGDVGEELFAIVEGTVRVVQRTDGASRLIRHYAAGDHIGELAVLREGIRTATVLADEPGVRALVLAGDAVRAILLERPEAAMAMLATLAHRISTQ